jgi:hypothetical protein
MFHESDSSQDLLAEWRWLLGGQAHLVGWASSGDLFAIDRRGAVLRLDTGGGEFETVAASVGDFGNALRDPARANKLLLLPVVRAFEQQQGALRAGECLGFTVLPVFGGVYTVDNRFRLPITEHAAVTGELQRQLRDLPNGGTVPLKIVP